MKATQETKKIMARTAVLAALLSLAACAPQSHNTESQVDSASTQSQGIISGDNVAANDPLVKSTVGIAVADSRGRGQVVCTGTLISKNMVITAGHCTAVTSDPRRMAIVFGGDLSAKTVQIRRVLGGRVPDQWPLLDADKQEKDWNDIAVLKIEGEAPAGFTPAVLLANKAALTSGAVITIAGFGVTDMKTQNQPKILQKAVVKLTDPKFADSEILFAQDDGKGACHGDSGGPAYMTIKGRSVLVGVTSRSATLAGAATCLDGSIYTSVAAHTAFIKKAVSDMNAKTFVAGQFIPRPRGF